MIDLKKILKNVCIFTTIFTCVLGVFVSSKIDLFADDSLTSQPIAVGDGWGESAYSVGDFIDGIKVASIKNGLPFANDGSLICDKPINGFRMPSAISLYSNEIYTNVGKPTYAQFSSVSSGYFRFYLTGSSNSSLSTFLYKNNSNTIVLLNVLISTSSNSVDYLYKQGNTQDAVTSSSQYSSLRMDSFKYSFYSNGNKYYFGYYAVDLLSKSSSNVDIGIAYPCFYVNPNMKVMDYSKGVINDSFHISDLIYYYLSVGSDYLTQSQLRSSVYGADVGSLNGWFPTNPSLNDILILRGHFGLNEDDFVYSSTNASAPSVPTATPGTGGTTPTPTPGTGGTTPTPTPGTGGSSSSIDYTDILNSIKEHVFVSANMSTSINDTLNTINSKLDLIQQILNQGLGQIKSAITDFSLKSITDKIHSFIDKFDAVDFSSKLTDIKVSIDALYDGLFDKPLIGSHTPLEKSILGALDDIVDAVKKIKTGDIVNESGTNLWDFLTELIKGLEETIKGLFNLSESVIDLMNNIVNWFLDVVTGWFTPDEKLKDSLNDKVGELKEKTGFIGQSGDMVKDVYIQFQNADSKINNGSGLTFKWSNIDLFGQTLINGGSINLQNEINSYGLSDAQTLVRTICDSLMILGTVVMVERKLKGWLQ